MSRSLPLVFRSQGSGKVYLGIEQNGVKYRLTTEQFDVSDWLALDDPIAWLKKRLKGELSPIVEPELLPPVDRQEVWASGVTYLRSKVARMEESAEGGDLYDKVYEAERPELFFKSTAGRVVGTGQPIRIRRDSAWNVPEPELALVLSASGRVVGYAVGNDVSSRSIEGENPLYLPQAKVYDGSCAIGPMIAVNTGEKIERTIEMTILRNGDVLFRDSVSTGRIKRSEEELAEYLFREMSFPFGAFLLTGTGIVPPDDFSLESGDRVQISIEGIGTLENPVE